MEEWRITRAFCMKHYKISENNKNWKKNCLYESTHIRFTFLMKGFNFFFLIRSKYRHKLKHITRKIYFEMLRASVQRVLPSLQFNEFINWIILRFEPLKDKHLSPSHSGYPRFRRTPRYICKFRSEFGVMVSHSFHALRLPPMVQTSAQSPLPPLIVWE